MKKALGILLAGTLLAAAAVPAAADELDYPKQNINVIVQYSAGGGTDMSVRGMLDAVEDVPVNFAVSNVTGNGGLIGLTQVANSDADGYTVGVVNTDFVINIILGNTDLTLDDFDPLACALRDPFVLIIGKNDNYSTLEEFVAYAKEHPGEIVMGDTGTGAAPTLAIQAVENALGIDVTNVTYDGSAGCVTAIVGGHIDATFAQPSNATAQVEAGNCIFAGVLANDRLVAFPDVPTFAEVYPDEIDFEVMGFCIASTPAGVDEGIRNYLSEKFMAAIDSESFQNTLSTMGMQTSNMNPDELREFLNSQKALYEELLAAQ